MTLACALLPPGCLPSGRHLAHRNAPLAAINGSDPVSLTQADQGSPVIGVLAQQALVLQLVQQVAPAGSAVLASDAERRDLGLRSRSILGLTQQVVDDPAATEPAAQAVHGRERFLRATVTSMASGGFRQRSHWPQAPTAVSPK